MAGNAKKKPGGRTPGFAVLLRAGKEGETALKSSPIRTAWIAKGSRREKIVSKFMPQWDLKHHERRDP
jgi:hypothetical protein